MAEMTSERQRWAEEDARAADEAGDRTRAAMRRAAGERLGPQPIPMGSAGAPARRSNFVGNEGRGGK